MPGDTRLVGKEIDGFRDGHVQYISDVLVFKRDVQRVAVITGSLAHLARHVNIWKEMHFNLDRSITGAGFAATTRNIETETTWLIAAHFRFGGCRKQLSNVVENPRVGCGVRTRSSANW